MANLIHVKNHEKMCDLGDPPVENSFSMAEIQNLLEMC